MKIPWELSKHDFIIVVCCILCGFISIFNVIMISSNVGAIQKLYEVDYALVSAFSQIVLLSFIAFFLVSIAITDKYGKKVSLITGLLIFSVSLALGSVSPNFIILSMFRVVTGLGVALMQTSCLSVITDLVGKKYLSEALAFSFAASSAASVTSPYISRFIMDCFGLTAMYLTMVPVALLIAYLIRNMDNVRIRPDIPIDWPMNIAYMVSLGLIISALMYPTFEYRWMALALGIVMFCVFVFLFTRSPNRNLELGMLRTKAFAFGLVLAFVMTFCGSGIQNTVTQFLQFNGSEVSVFGIVVSMTAFSTFLIAFRPLLQAGFSPLISRYYRNRSTKNVIVVSFVLLIASSLLVAAGTRSPNRDFSFVAIIVVFILFALSTSLFTPRNKAMMMSSVPSEQRNAASSVTSLTTTVASMCASAILVNLIESCTNIDGFLLVSMQVFAITFVVAIVGLVIALWRRKADASVNE